MSLIISVQNAECKLQNVPRELDIILKGELRYKNADVEFKHQKVLRDLNRLYDLISSDKFIGDDLYRQKAKLQHTLRGLEQKLYTNLYQNSTFPTGLLPRVETIIKHLGLTPQIQDLRKIPKKGTIKFDLKESLPPLRYYQKAAAKKLEDQARGVVVMPTGCHAKGQGILKFDGSIVKVEDLIVGDLLMGPDSTPRRISQLYRGSQEMVKIIPVKGDPFIVNKDHVLSLKRTAEGKGREKKKGEIINISVRDYLTKSKSFKHIHKLYRVPVNFTSNVECLEIPPYILGLWLGDGHSSQAALTTMNQEIYEEWINWGRSLDLGLTIHSQPKNKASVYCLTRNKKSRLNKATALLRQLKILNNKHIPLKYLTSSRSERLELLAGLIDTDGSLSSNGFDYISKSEVLAKDVAFLCRSLGLSAYIKPCKKRSQNGTEGLYFRVYISGNTSIIPCRLKYKKARARLQKKDVLVTGFSTQELPENDYYGFELDKDHLYLLDDFTVTHNTGKTKTACRMVWDLGLKTLIITPGKSITEHMLEEFIRYFGKGKVEELTSKSKKTKDINIVNIQALIKLKPDLFHDIDCVIIDEFHHAGASTYLEVNANHLKSCYYRLGLTATPWRNGGDELALESVLSNILYEYPVETAIKEGFIMKPEFRLIGFNNYNDEGNYQDEYKSCIVENLNRNMLIADIAKEHEKDHVLVLVQRVEHGERLKDLIPNASFIHGKETSTIRKRLLADFKSGKIKCLIGTSVIGEGVDLPIADVLILAGAGKSSIQVMQNVGRVLRLCPGKTKAIIYDFTDEGSKWLEEHCNERLIIYNQYES